ncbi:MAG: hypothetical protein RL531_1412 [Actinomycetota bacterium]|jgi:histidinol-phosphatase
MDADLAFALELADLADAVTLARFRAADLAVERKRDTTHVTDADTAAERVIRTAILERFPEDAILGEEFGAEGRSGRRWIIDPIDGTSNYLRGIPVWATLIGLERDGRCEVGVVSAPAMPRRWWAARGEGAYADGRPIRVSDVDDLADAQLCYGELPLWEMFGIGEPFRALVAAVWRTRGFGDFWQHMLVAEGGADIALEPIVNLWDLAAIQPIVEEAGGRFTDHAGVATPGGGNAISTNGRLHDRVLAYFSPSAG